MNSVRNVPAHVAVIMDGNGRWAKKRGLPRLMGHRAGISALERVVRAAGESGVSYLSVYAFSTEIQIAFPFNNLYALFTIDHKDHVKICLRKNNQNIQAISICNFTVAINRTT